MIEMALSEAARVLNGRLEGADGRFSAVTTDSRRAEPGQLFVALRGDRFDGHGFVDDVSRLGAAGVVVDHLVETTLPQVVVEDTRRALGQLGRAWRQAAGCKVVGVTGSNGKTTVKEMLAAILARVAPSLSTQGNLNNEIGVPLTLLQLDTRHRFAVVEMGCSHAGDIAYLAGLAEPDVGLVTNAGPAHLEGLGSIDGVARTKGELFEALGATGTAVINADDVYAPLWRERAGKARIIDFGFQESAAVHTAGSAEQRLVATPEGTFPLQLNLLGRHNVLNALAATAAAVALEVPLADIAAGLASMRGVAGRLDRRRAQCGALVIDDSYNANPASLEAGIAVLLEQAGEPWLVLGDMGELGDEGPRWHAGAGRQCREAGVKRLFALGALAAEAAKGFGEGARSFTDCDTLIRVLQRELRPDVAVLVKGSRLMGMERVVAALTGPSAATRTTES